MAVDRENLLDALLAAGGGRLAMFDPAARLLVVNRPFADALGRRPGQLEGLTLAEAGIAQAAALEAQVRAVAASGTTLSVGGLLPDGDVTLAPERDASGAVVAVVARGRNPAEEARALNSRFLSTASHDLRQPIQAMQLFHHLLLTRITEPSAHEMVERMGQAMEGAESFIRLILEAASLEGGLVRAQRGPVAVDDVLSTLLQEFEPKAEAKGLRLSVRPADLSIVTDQNLLERLLRHVVDNAVRYTDRGGVLIAARRRGALLRLEVWDTGPGIPEADLPALFDDFHQIAGRERTKGHGFGLSLVRRLSAVLGHPVRVRSRIGHGTVISVDIPAVAAPVRVLEAAPVG
ncbi:sensor histidine kinase [Azospirillum sp. sgz301742]